MKSNSKLIAPVISALITASRTQRYFSDMALADINTKLLPRKFLAKINFATDSSVIEYSASIGTKTLVYDVGDFNKVISFYEKLQPRNTRNNYSN